LGASTRQPIDGRIAGKVPDEFYQWVRATIDEFWETYRKLEAEAKAEYKASRITAVENIKVTEINPEVLIKNGLASKNDVIKILGRGELKAKVDINVHAFTATAKKAIEDKGGKATQVK